MHSYERGAKALELLRRLLDGDEKAWIEGEEFLKKVDEQHSAAEKTRADKEARKKKRQTSGRKASGLFDIAPRVEHGVDYSADGIVLLRRGDLRLVWRSGGKYFSGIGQQGYGPAELEILFPDRCMSTTLTDHHRNNKSQRLSRALVLHYEKEIDEVFGEGAAKQAAKLKGTVRL